jgi:hypothetical protein
MFAFVTAFRAKALAHDWPYHVWLLERTIDSMLAQGDGVSVVVGCHDVPDTPLTRDPRVHFLQTTIAHPRRTFDDMTADKVVKHSLGAAWAIGRGAEWVIFNDADDLVSNRVVPHLRRAARVAGWYSASQYFYSYGGRLARFSKVGGQASGPFVAIRSDLLKFSTPPFLRHPGDTFTAWGDESYVETLSRYGVPVCVLAAIGHGHYRSYLAGEGHELQPLPFPANLVINHGDSMSTSGGKDGYPVRSALGWLRHSVRLLPTLTLATPSLRREYQIPRDIPARYQSSGSVFWR